MYLKEKLNSKQSNSEEVPTNTIPIDQDVHFFQNWQNYLDNHFSKLIDKTIQRCNSQCRYEAEMATGRNVINNTKIYDNCANKCNSEWGQSLESQKKV